MPEIYLATTITFLLGYGAFYMVGGGLVHLSNRNYPNNPKNIPGRNNLFLHFNYICFFILAWTFLLLCALNNKLTFIGDILYNDSFSIYVKYIVLFSVSSILFISMNLYSKYKIFDYEFSLLILLSLLGIYLIISARDLIIMYLAIETLSLSLYVLAAVVRTSSYGAEAGLKYFVLGALGSGLLLFGCALIYFSTGLSNFDALSNLISLNHFDNAFLIGAIFLIISLLFKLAAAPFHM